MPAWHRRSHAPGWGGVAATGAPRKKGAPDDREARSGPTIVMRRTEVVLQTPAEDEGWRRKAPNLPPGGYRDARFVPTIDMRPARGCYSGPDVRINTLTRSGCPDQRWEEGQLYRHGSSRRRLLAATMVMGISREGNASDCGKPQQHHDGINLVFTQHHPRVKERQSQVICDTRPTNPTPRGHCCARRVRYHVCCFIDRAIWLFPTIASIRPPHRETPSTLRTTRHF